jgi:hypothetical protein
MLAIGPDHILGHINPVNIVTTDFPKIPSILSIFTVVPVLSLNMPVSLTYLGFLVLFIYDIYPDQQNLCNFSLL